jgi:secretion/DNA translocation related CpaE-like protein
MDRPVALIEEAELMDDILRLAAAAGCDIERVPDAAGVRLRWGKAPLVILDSAGARDCRQLGLARRGSVIVVCTQPAPAELWQRAVSVGAEQVVELPAGEAWLIGALADAAEAPAGTTGGVLAVLGGRGGSGASVFAASVGLTVLRDGGSALLIDCAPIGGGLDLVLGAETDNGLRWPDMRLRSGRVPASSLHSALPGRTRGSGRLAVLSGAREGTGPEPDALAAVLESGRRAGDTVICDLPRALGDSAWAALDRADLAVIVTPAEVRASMAAKLVARRVLDRGVSTQVIVRGPAPGGLGAKEVAAAVGVPLLTWMRPEPNLAHTLERGRFQPRPRGPLTAAARTTLAELGARSGHEIRAAS